MAIKGKTVKPSRGLHSKGQTSTLQTGKDTNISAVRMRVMCEYGRQAPDL